ncbi:MAG: hypothetical protein LW878_12945 [Proteobacteria bacterium]|nr:hypothetical protein [Pseudomonadota bacterium]
MISGGELQTNVGDFAPTLYAPGTVSNNRFTSVVGISFKALPLANKKPASRIFFVEFEAIASLANGQKRFIQQNAKVEDTMLLNVKDDEVIETEEETEGGDKTPTEGGSLDHLMTPTTIMFGVGALAGCLILITLIVSLFVYQYKLRKEEQLAEEGAHEFITDSRL